MCLRPPAHLGPEWLEMTRTAARNLGFADLAALPDEHWQRVLASVETRMRLKGRGCGPRARLVVIGDGTSTSNGVGNLGWPTARENADDKRRHGTPTRTGIVPLGKLCDAAVLDIQTSTGTQAVAGSVPQ